MAQKDDVIDDIEINDEPIIEEGREQSMKDIDLDALLEKHSGNEEKEGEGDEEDESTESSEESKEKEEGTEAESKESEKQVEEEVEGYYADEVLEDEEEETAPSLPDGTKPKTPQEELASYIYEGLQPITVTGTSGGKAVRLTVKVAEELPDDFEFSSVKDQASFNQSLAAQAISAKNLADSYLNTQQQQETQAYNARERRDIATDIAKLQREGLIPTFTPGMSVDEDPRAEVAREVLKFYEAEKAKRLEVANKNQRLYYPPSFEDAYYLWKSRNNQTGEKQKAEDKERKEIASRQAKPSRGANASEGKKGVGLPSTASWDQVINEALKLY
jgi:hypothetical protein